MRELLSKCKITHRHNQWATLKNAGVIFHKIAPVEF